MKDTPNNDDTIVLTILGSGTSTGVPMSGCDCAVCTSTDPKDNRLRSSALINFRGENILIDAGPDFRTQSLREKIPSIDAVLFTHAHADHIVGIDDLRPYCFKQRQAIPCYGAAETLEQIRAVFFYIFDKDPNYQGGGLADLTLNPVVHGEKFEICGLTITPFSLTHGNMTTSGFRFGNIAYATDCRIIPHESQQLLDNIEHLIITGLRYKSHPTHMTIDQACEVATKLAAKNTYLIHMSHAVGHQATMDKLPEGVCLCYDGMRIQGRV